MADYINILLLYDRKDRKGALQLVKIITTFLENVRLGPVYFADRDALPGTDIFDELNRVIDLAKFIICLVTPGFTKQEWNRWVGKVARKQNLERGEQQFEQKFIVLRDGVSDTDFANKCSMFSVEEPLTIPTDLTLDKTSHLYTDSVKNFLKRLGSTCTSTAGDAYFVKRYVESSIHSRPEDERNARPYKEEFPSELQAGTAGCVMDSRCTPSHQDFVLDSISEPHASTVGIGTPSYHASKEFDSDVAGATQSVKQLSLSECNSTVMNVGLP